MFHKYLELTPAKPKLRKLHSLLEQTPYDGKTCQHPGWTTDALLDKIQASEKELMAGLAAMEACEIGRAWFLLDTDYTMRVLSLITNFIEENSWPLDKVLKAETVETLGDLEPAEVVAQVFGTFLKQAEDNKDHFCLHRDAVSRFYGKYLLQTGTAFDLAEFETMWQQSVPEGVETKLEHLRGIGLVEKSDSSSRTGNSVIRYFPEGDLSENVQQRLSVLFGLRKRWTVEEMEPYVETLTTPTLNVNALLTKYARALNVDGMKYFCSKHGN